MRSSVASLGFGCILCTQPSVVQSRVGYPSAAPGVPIVGNRCKRAPPRACTACGVQVDRNGGLVSIAFRSTGNVSVVGSTLTNITVRAHCRVPCEYPRTAAPVRLLRTAQCRRTGSASTRSTRPEYRLGAQYSQRTWVPPGTFGWAPPRACAACGVQANRFGGLVGILDGGTGHVSVVGSTLTNIAVRAHFLSTLLSTGAPRLPSGCSVRRCTARRVLRVRAVPDRAHRLGAQYSQRTGGTAG